MRIKMLAPAVVAGALAVGCATNPATGNREFSLMSEAQEIQLGQQMDVEVRKEMGVYEDAALQRYVEGVGMRLARGSDRPNLPWHFTVVDSPAVNAFALPGGYVYLTRGIMPFLDNEAQLAGVLGHEIGHVTARHSAQQYTKATTAGLGLTLLSIFVPESRPFGGLAESGLGLLFLKHGRDDERQADSLGVEYTARTGWDPSGVAGMLNTLARLDEASGSHKGVPNWLSTHPAPAERVQEVQAAIRQASAKLPGKPVVDEAEFLNHVDGIIYGDSPSEGIVRGNAFLHPELRLALTFPQGWEIQNTKTAVVAKAPDRDNYVLMQLVPPTSGGSLEDVARRSMANAGFRQLAGEPAQINGVNAYVGTWQGTMQGLGNVVTRTAHLSHGRNVYLLAGIAPANQFQSADRQFASTIRSFRPLNASEAGNIRPNRVDLYTVRGNETWQSLSERTGGVVKPSTLAIMNDYDPNQPPRPGDRIKVVVEG
ncbi:MAG TPA: M48 family metalloprotease [Vicinamibacterales bacterium]